MKDRQSVTKALCAQYRKASKSEKGALLDQFVEATGYNRCYARLLLRNHGRKVEIKPGVIAEGSARRHHTRKSRMPEYGPDVQAALKKVWESLDYITGKRLAAALPEVVPRMVAQKELRISRAVREKLMRISAATIDRLLQTERAKHQLKGRSLTKPGTLLKHQIPIRTFADWDQSQPGFVEIDLVGHDGGSSLGDHCYTLDVTDVSTGWTEQAATQNKAQMHVFSAIERIRKRLPFPMLGLDSDNGSEFINSQLKRWCEQEEITFTRGRPYRKNDTCYVEQKNWSVVRRFTGYARFEGEDTRALLDALYLLLRDYNNFFLPSMKLKEKTRDGAKVTRKYDKAKTPYQRMMESPQIEKRTKKHLKAYYEQLNHVKLRRDILALQKKLQKKARRPPSTNGKER